MMMMMMMLCNKEGDGKDIVSLLSFISTNISTCNTMVVVPSANDEAKRVQKGMKERGHGRRQRLSSV